MLNGQVQHIVETTHCKLFHRNRLQSLRKQCKMKTRVLTSLCTEMNTDNDQHMSPNQELLFTDRSQRKRINRWPTIVSPFSLWMSGPYCVLLKEKRRYFDNYRIRPYSSNQGLVWLIRSSCEHIRLNRPDLQYKVDSESL
ncbi:hypothetical protein CEXT_695711 [Caerostris extrusa]|uniref:Uncharacterized protein n=1 Tax=Caerostris extrusa TaxID=172846 RepID=A0AAV4PY30_CAEEX|nr:hypothetical protein CEXT_695711 [Caerostris extrusa]